MLLRLRMVSHGAVECELLANAIGPIHLGEGLNTMTGIRLLILTTFLGLSQMAFAFDPAVTPSSSTLSVSVPTSVSPLAPANDLGFHSLINLSTISNLYSSSSHDHEANTHLTVIPSFQMTEHYSLAAKAILSHDEVGARNTSVSDTKIGVSRKSTLRDGYLTHSFSFSGIAPTNEDSQKKDRLRGGLRFDYGMVGGWKAIEATYVLGLARNFHEYTVNADGEANIQYGVVQDLDLVLKFTPKWSVELDSIYRMAWSYENFQHNRFSFESSVNYEVSKAWILSAAVSNEGEALRASGTGSNVNIYNERTSVVKAAVTFVN